MPEITMAKWIVPSMMDYGPGHAFFSLSTQTPERPTNRVENLRSLYDSRVSAHKHEKYRNQHSENPSDSGGPLSKAQKKAPKNPG